MIGCVIELWKYYVWLPVWAGAVFIFQHMWLLTTYLGNVTNICTDWLIDWLYHPSKVSSDRYRGGMNEWPLWWGDEGRESAPCYTFTAWAGSLTCPCIDHRVQGTSSFTSDANDSGLICNSYCAWDRAGSDRRTPHTATVAELGHQRISVRRYSLKEIGYWNHSKYLQCNRLQL